MAIRHIGVLLMALLLAGKSRIGGLSFVIYRARALRRHLSQWKFVEIHERFSLMLIMLFSWHVVLLPCLTTVTMPLPPWCLPHLFRLTGENTYRGIQIRNIPGCKHSTIQPSQYLEGPCTRAAGRSAAVGLDVPATRLAHWQRMRTPQNSWITKCSKGPVICTGKHSHADLMLGAHLTKLIAGVQYTLAPQPMLLAAGLLQVQAAHQRIQQVPAPSPNPLDGFELPEVELPPVMATINLTQIAPILPLLAGLNATVVSSWVPVIERTPPESLALVVPALNAINASTLEAVLAALPYLNWDTVLAIMPAVNAIPAPTLTAYVNLLSEVRDEPTISLVCAPCSRSRAGGVLCPVPGDNAEWPATCQQHEADRTAAVGNVGPLKSVS